MMVAAKAAAWAAAAVAAAAASAAAADNHMRTWRRRMTTTACPPGPGPLPQIEETYLKVKVYVNFIHQFDQIRVPTLVHYYYNNRCFCALMNSLSIKNRCWYKRGRDAFFSYQLFLLSVLSCRATIFFKTKNYCKQKVKTTMKKKIIAAQKLIYCNKRSIPRRQPSCLTS